jgi:predicted metal-dependent phosphoesterase TrpH
MVIGHDMNTGTMSRLKSERLKFADLHIHTRSSDGKIAAEEVVRHAQKAELAAIAIADHDTVEGVEIALRVDKRYGIEIIPSVELSSEVENKELHILGYFIDWRAKWFRDKLSQLQEARRERGRNIIEKLGRLGVEIPYETVISSDGKVLGRPHIAQAMLDHGYVKTIDEAFYRYLGMGKPAYVKKFPLSPEEAINMIRKLGGVPVLAHPVFARADDMLPELIEMGLRGIEVYHSNHDAKTTEHYEEIAKKYGLLVTGGSDAHGLEVPIGSVRIPYYLVEELKKAANAGW